MMQEIRVQYNQNKGGEERDIIWKPQGSGKRAKGKNACGKQKPLPKSSNPLKGLNNLFISYEKQNTKEAYNSNGNLERV